MPTILVVEDTATDRAVIAGSLQRGGYNVVAVGSETEARSRLAEALPDAIVLDIVLPDRSGFELCRELKEDRVTEKIPIVLCSSKNSNMDRYWGIEQGADAYLGKPIDEVTLLEAVRKLV